LDVVIIGAGVAGLAAAIRLRIRGHRVTVLEANPVPGGKLASLSLGGFRFDTGPSLFTMPGLLDELFAVAGRDRRDSLSVLEKVEGTLCLFPDGAELRAWAEPQRFAEEAARALGVAEERVLRYFAGAAFTYQRLGRIFVERPLDEPSTWMHRDVLAALHGLSRFHLFSTLHGANLRELREPRTVQYFDRMATYNGSSPFRAPGVLSMIPHLEHGLGTYLPERGMIGIVESLAQLAEELGIRFEFGTRATRIALSGSRVLGVEAGGQRFAADVVLMNGDVLHAYRDLLPETPELAALAHRERSSSGLVFFFGLGRRFPRLKLHNVLFSGDYPEEFRALFERGDISRDPTVYVYVSSKDVPGDAPEGGENWFVMVNAPADRGQDWDTLIPRARSDVLEKLERMLGEPVERHIEVESRLDPRDLERRTSAVGGALYGTSSNSPLAAFLRHPNRSRYRGLYFCGGTVHPGGGIPLCLSSAKIVADNIGADHG